jgi:ribose-phosphate pyrophosphokinase
VKPPIILSTARSQYFATLIAEKLPASTELSMTRKPFGDGERYLKIDLDDRMELFGRDVIIVGSTATDDDFNEVCRVGVAAAKYGARRIIYVIPFFGYSTMERAVKPGEIVTAKINARQLSQLPHGDVRNCFLMLDLHTAGLVHYFEGECLRFELYAESVLTDAVRNLGLTNFMFASADLGRPLWVETFAKKFRTDLAFVRKSRDFETTKVDDVIGSVTGKNVVIYDDMIRSGTSLIHAADAYLEKGALAVYAVASHLALNDWNAIERLADSSIRSIIATNSHPMSHQEVIEISPKFVVRDVSHLFVDAILKLTGKEGD